MALKDTDDAKMETDEADSSLDMSQAAVKKMIADARERGYITYDQLNAVLPPNQASSEQIEDVMSMLSEMGINVIEDEEAEEGLEPAGELVETSTSREVAVKSLWPAPRPKRWTARMTRCGCICAKWARWSCCPARAKLPSPNASRPVATR
jgi:hypothetical protein